MVFEWKNFPRHTTLQLFQEIQEMMDEMKCPPEKFTDRITFMSMHNDRSSSAIMMIRTIDVGTAIGEAHHTTSPFSQQRRLKTKCLVSTVNSFSDVSGLMFVPSGFRTSVIQHLKELIPGQSVRSVPLFVEMKSSQTRGNKL